MIGYLRKRRVRKRLEGLLGSRPMMHMPDDLLAPESVAVCCGRSEERVWASMYMAAALREHYGGERLHGFCAPRDRELMAVVVEGDKIHDLPGDCLEAEEELFRPSIVFCPYAGLTLEEAVDIAAPGCAVAGTADHPAVNLRVRVVGGHVLPESIRTMCELLRISYPEDWAPRVPRNDLARAEALLAPVSGHAMPYIAATSKAADVLRASGVEIPLKMVMLDGDESPVGGADRAVRAAVIAGATAVATDSGVVWSDACALGVPVVGLDRDGRFPGWEESPANAAEPFVEGWKALLRRGW